MAPDIRRHAETRQTNAATPAALLIVVRATPRQHAQKHRIQNYYIPKRPLTCRMKLNMVTTISSIAPPARTGIYAHPPLGLDDAITELLRTPKEVGASNHSPQTQPPSKHRTYNPLSICRQFFKAPADTQTSTQHSCSHAIADPHPGLTGSRTYFLYED